MRRRPSGPKRAEGAEIARAGARACPELSPAAQSTSSEFPWAGRTTARTRRFDERLLWSRCPQTTAVRLDPGRPLPPVSGLA